MPDNISNNIAANNLVDSIKNIVLQLTDGLDTTHLCRIAGKNNDNTYNVFVGADGTHIISRIPSIIDVDLEIGDDVYVYAIRNQLNNSFIIKKVSNDGSLNQSAIQNANTITSLVSSVENIIVQLQNKQNQLYSGQNIKTINGDSILGSGDLSVTGEDDYRSMSNKPSINGVELLGDLTTSDLKINAPLYKIVNLTSSAWTSSSGVYVQTKSSLSDISASSIIVCSPQPSSMSEAITNKVYCSDQGTRSLTFTASTKPSSTIEMGVLVMNPIS